MNRMWHALQLMKRTVFHSGVTIFVRSIDNWFPFGERFANAVCVALTATATPRVQQDIKQSLKIQEDNEFIASFDRENLFMGIELKVEGCYGRHSPFSIPIVMNPASSTVRRRNRLNRCLVD